MSCAASPPGRLLPAVLIAGITLAGATQGVQAQPQPGTTAANPATPAPATPAHPAAPAPGHPATPGGAPGAPAAPAADALSPANKAKASYAIGLSFGKQMKDAGLSNKTLSMPDFDRGLQAALGGKEVKREDMEPIQGYIMALRQNLADENHAKAKEFLEANAHKPGVSTTASGLQYRVIQAGQGDPPKRTDTVSILYTGRLMDGTVFDSTDLHGGQAASMPVGNMIPGFTEALMLMRPGGKYEVWIPPALAYDTHSPPQIPPGSLLHFEIQLQKIQAGPAPGQPGAPAAPGQAPHPVPQPHPPATQPH